MFFKLADLGGLGKFYSGYKQVIGQHNKKGFIEINFVGIIDLKANFKYTYINNTIC